MILYIGVAIRAILRFGPSMMLRWLWEDTPACSLGSYTMPISDDVPNVTVAGKVGVWAEAVV